MKRMIALVLLCLFLTGCAVAEPQPENPLPPEQGQTGNEQSQPQHSPLYLPGLEVDEVITYFNEVCLDAEITTSGNPSLLQKWDSPIYYWIDGDYTDQDLAVLEGFAHWLNTVEGFPGIQQAESPLQAKMHIHFCLPDAMASTMGDWTYGLDGAVTFNYRDNRIYHATICYRSDIAQEIRNSVILEEIYNGLGPIQDTDLRSDSIIYAGYSIPQSLTAVDELLLRLLYHPQMICGMDAAQCAEVIRQLYY